MKRTFVVAVIALTGTMPTLALANKDKTPTHCFSAKQLQLKLAEIKLVNRDLADQLNSAINQRLNNPGERQAILKTLTDADYCVQKNINNTDAEVRFGCLSKAKRELSFSVGATEIKGSLAYAEQNQAGPHLSIYGIEFEACRSISFLKNNETVCQSYYVSHGSEPNPAKPDLVRDFRWAPTREDALLGRGYFLWPANNESDLQKIIQQMELDNPRLCATAHD